MTTTKDGNAVLLPEEDYSGIVETLYLDKSFLHRGPLTFFGPEVELRQKWMLLLP